jgi:hypothetical protein
VAKRGKTAVTICSTAFLTLGIAQAQALGNAHLPIAVIPHPFGSQTRQEIRQNAAQCVDEIVRLVSEVTP